jgi:hypothetical protein
VRHDPRVSVTRALVLAYAIVSCAWFALGANQAHDLAKAAGIVGNQTRLPRAQASQAAGLLDSAATLNPDLQVDVERAQLALDQGSPARARAILFRVIKREPDFLGAWVVYARASANDRFAFYAAQIGIRRLLRSFPARH